MYFLRRVVLVLFLVLLVLTSSCTVYVDRTPGPYYGYYGSYPVYGPPYYPPYRYDYYSYSWDGGWWLSSGGHFHHHHHHH